VLPKHGRLLRPRPVRVRIGPAFSPEKVQSADLKALSREARDLVAELARG